MTIIKQDDLIESIADALQYISYYHPLDFIQAMDEAYQKHHMWVRPRLQALPSEYFRRQGFASFGEDPPGLLTAEPFDLVDNFLWANDYPHHEGTWPHSAQAIERTNEIAQRALEFSLDELRYDYPEEVCPKGRAPIAYLRELTYAGAAGRFADGPDTPRSLGLS